MQTRNALHAIKFIIFHPRERKMGRAGIHFTHKHIDWIIQHLIWVIVLEKCSFSQ